VSCQNFTTKLESTGHLHNHLNERSRPEVATEVAEYDEIKMCPAAGLFRDLPGAPDIEKARTPLLGARYKVRQAISRDYLYAPPCELCRKLTIGTPQLERPTVTCP
jgi:hypothetical protein